MTHDAFAGQFSSSKGGDSDDERVSPDELLDYQSQFRALTNHPKSGLDEPDNDILPGAIGRFQILKRIGSGNSGSVYLAYDSRLTRQVAIKVSHMGAHLTGEQRKWFKREAHAAARLAHQNVVCLHEYGEEGGVLYLVYEMCGGPTLADWLAARTEPVPMTMAAAIVREIANGLSHAHLRGLIHRDVKPNNILLPPNHDASSSLPFIPRVTDFGLAHDSLSLEQMSQSARLVGTLDFMSPEQARGENRNVTPASDQYSLGVILYQLLTGKLPFESENFVEHLQRLCREQPRSPRSLRPEVPRDLAAIVLTCLNKTPELRYASCRELARDLDRYLRGVPVTARPLRLHQHVWRNICAAPIESSLISLIVLGCLGSAIVYSQMAASLQRQQIVLQKTLAELTASESTAVRARKETERALQSETRQKQEAEQQAQQAVLQAYRADMHRAYEAWSKQRVLETSELLASVRDNIAGFIDPAIDFRLLANAARETALSMSSHGSPATDVKPIRGTPWIVSADQSGQIHFHNAVTGELVHSTLIAAGSEIHAIDVSFDGKLIAVGGRDKLLGINFANVHSLNCEGYASWIGKSHAMYFSPTTVESLQFSRDLRFLAVGPRYSPIMVYDCQTHQLLRTFASESRNRTVDFSPDGQHCLVMGKDNSLHIYNTQSGELVRSVPCRKSVQLARWSPTGEWLAVSLFSDSVVQLVSNVPPYQSSELTQSRGTIESLCFSDDGQWLAVGTRRGGVATWPIGELSSEAPPPSLECDSQVVLHSNDVNAVCIDEQGRISSVSESGAVVSDSLLRDEDKPLGEEVVLAIVMECESMQRLVTGTRDGRVVEYASVDEASEQSQKISYPVTTELSNVTTKRELLGGGNSAVSAFSFDPIGRRLATGWHDGRVVIVDLDTGNYLEYKYPSPKDSLDERRLNCLSFSADGRHLSACGDDGRLRMWSTGQPERPLWEFRHNSYAYATCFCGPKHVAVGGMFEEILLLDIGTGAVSQRILGAQRTGCLMYDDKRQRLVSGHTDGRLRIYAGRDLALLDTVDADGGEVKSLAASADHAFYFSGDVAGNLRLWSAENCELVGSLHTCAQKRAITALQWSTSQQELLAFFDGQNQLSSPSARGGLHLNTFSARKSEPTDLPSLNRW